MRIIAVEALEGKMTEDEKYVVSKYPAAYCCQLYDGDEPVVVIGYAVYDNGGAGKKLGPVANTAAQAWAGCAVQRGLRVAE